MTLLEAKGLKKIYQSGEVQFTALHDINLKIEAGDFIALCGPSGSGKTTLLNLLGTLDEVTSGEIEIESKTIKGLSDRQLAELRRHHFGYIFQTFNLLPVLTALENVQMPLIRKGLGSEESLIMAYEVLDRVGLKSVVHHYPSQLSGGQKQRVAIARALAVKPKVILADEPTASLDATRAREILHLLQDLNIKDQKTIVFSTHDPEIMAMAKRLIYLRDGHIVNEEKK